MPDTVPRIIAIDYSYEESQVATDFLRDAPLEAEQHAPVSHRNPERLFRIRPAQT